MLYGRVSQDRIEGKSVDDQLAECLAWARREGWRVVVEHRDDGISACRYAHGKARPGRQSTMDLITSGKVDLLAGKSPEPPEIAPCGRAIGCLY
jgi:DNA invertase Pin-like site-specific DNA recombinase